MQEQMNEQIREELLQIIEILDDNQIRLVLSFLHNLFDL